MSEQFDAWLKTLNFKTPFSASEIDCLSLAWDAAVRQSLTLIEKRLIERGKKEYNGHCSCEICHEARLISGEIKNLLNNKDA